MDANFWLQRWENNQIGFHERQANPLLVAYFDTLSLLKGSRIFVPLCGKTLDIGWLLSQGYRVAGAELSQLAIEQLFDELGVEPEIAELGAIKHYSAPDIDIFVGDIFALTSELLGVVDAIYDRAALVALTEMLRTRYTEHLRNLTDNAPQMLVTYDYDQRQMDGPPFSVSADEVARHYAAHYDITSLIRQQAAGRLSQVAASENVWLLKSIAHSSKQA